MEKKVLIRRWLKDFPDSIQILDEASVSVAREKVRDLSRQNNLSPTVTEQAALLASELTHNQLRHARGGFFGVRTVDRDGIPGLEIVAADRGPGIKNPAAALEGGVSTSGSLGAGLSAVYRLADETDFDVRYDEGTCVRTRKFSKAGAVLTCELAVLGRPCPGEAISGDDCMFLRTNSGFTAALADGLGHGPLARAASAKAVHHVVDNCDAELDGLIRDVDNALVDTRGSTLGLARFDAGKKALQFAGVGDLSAQVYHLKNVKYFPTSPFTLGNKSRHRDARIEDAMIEAGGVFTMFSDGLKTGATLHNELKVMRQPAISIAQHLLETYARTNDDATVFVAKFGRRVR